MSGTKRAPNRNPTLTRRIGTLTLTADFPLSRSVTWTRSQPDSLAGAVERLRCCLPRALSRRAPSSALIFSSSIIFKIFSLSSDVVIRPS